jgi:hypothetical protein
MGATITSQGGAPVLIEDFESFNVANGAFLDPTTVPFSGWTRNDKGVGPDWEVTCCSPGIAIPDDTFDDSDKHLRLRRASDTGIDRGQLNTDLEFAPMSQGSISFQLNPSERDYFSTETLAFHASLVDSVTDLPLMRVQYTERFGDNNGQFDVFSFTSSGASATTGPFGLPSGLDNLDRWYEVTMTILSNGFWHFRVEDIGPISPNPVSQPPFGAGERLNFTVAVNTPVTVVDTFRLDLFSGNGPSNTNQPTMIDNIMQDIVVAAPSAPIAGVEVEDALKISYATDSESLYQPQFSDELSSPGDGWTNLGIEVQGGGGTNCSGSAFAGVPDRAYRVLDSTFAAREVSDDFNDDSLDLTKWGVFAEHTSLNDSVTETNMMILIEEGGTLHTEDSFDPETPGGVTATGKVILHNLNDRLFFYFYGGDLGRHDNQRHGGLRWQIFGNGTNSPPLFLDEVRLKNQKTGGINPDLYGEDENTLTDIVPRVTILQLTMFAEGTNSTFEFVPATNDTSGATGRFAASATVEGPLSFEHRERRVLFQNNGAGNATMDMDDLLVRSGVPGFIGDPVQVVEAHLDGTEINFPSEVAKTYQPQFSDDGGTTWFDFGPRLRGNGETIASIDATTPGRIYQVLDLRP